MTALAIHCDAAPALASVRPIGMDRDDDRAWLPIARVAQILGVSIRSARTRCTKWESYGLAEKRCDPATGRATWRVHTAAHPDLLDHARRRLESSITETGHRAFDPRAALQGATRAQADRAVARARAVIAFRRWRDRGDVIVTRDIADFIHRLGIEIGLTPSQTQLYHWARITPSGSDVADITAIAASLLDLRGRGRGESVASHNAWEMFRSMYLAPNQLSVAHCWRVVKSEARRKGWAWPSLRRVQQMTRERLAPQVIDYHRLGRDAWATRHKAPIEQDADAWKPGECWESDHSTCDVYIQAVRGGNVVTTRPIVTAWLDRRTRMIMGIHVSLSGNSDTIRAALLDALRTDDVSPPACVWLDNGKDFASEQFCGVTKTERRAKIATEWGGLFARLGIETHFATPYNHNGKARIERFFSTMHTDFERTLESWCGSTPGQVDGKRRRALLADVASLPTLDDFRATLRDWIDYYNHRAEHAIDDLVDPATGNRLSPSEMYTMRGERRVLDDEGALSLLEQAWARPMKVGKRGVGLRFGGRTVRYGAMHPALEDLKGSPRRVFVTYDPSDTTSVRIYDESFRFLCVARENESYGGLDPITAQARKTAMAERRAVERRVRERIDTSALTLTDHELARRAQRDHDVAQTRARIAKETGSMPSANVRLVRTGLAGQAEKVQRAQSRIAAGAESMTPRRARRTDILDALVSRDAHTTRASARRLTVLDIAEDADL